MSTSVGIHGLWGLESQAMSSGFAKPVAIGRPPYRFEERRHYDIISSASSSDDELGESIEYFLDDELFTDKSAEIGDYRHDSRSSPIGICPKNEESSRALRRKSRRCAAEQSRDDAWERRRQMEELKSDSRTSMIVRSHSDCGQQPAASMIQPHDGDREPSCSRSRSLTEEDFEELRGCIDLGFRFNVDAEKEDPALCHTLPALEVCYAANRQLQDLQSPSGSSDSSPSWQIASPGEELQQVKEKLRHWARAVACISKQSC